MWLVICNNTKENFSWEPEKINIKFQKMTSYTWNFQNFTCVFTILVKFDNHFLGLPWKIFAKHSYKSYNHRVRWMGGQMGSGKTRFYTFYYLLLLLLLLLFSAVLLYMHVYWWYHLHFLAIGLFLQLRGKTSQSLLLIRD